MTSLKNKLSIEGHTDRQRFSMTIGAVRREIANLKKKNPGRVVQVLELGCGDGSFALGFAKEGCTVVALDISLDGVSPENRCERIAYVQADAAKLECEDCFDIIHAGEILEHVKSPRRLLKSMCRAAGRGALFMISVPNFKHPTHVRTFSQKSFARLLGRYRIQGTIKVLQHQHKDSRSKVFVCYDGRRR